VAKRAGGGKGRRETITSNEPGSVVIPYHYAGHKRRTAVDEMEGEKNRIFDHHSTGSIESTNDEEKKGGK